MEKSKKVIDIKTKRKKMDVSKIEHKIKDSSVLIFNNVCAVGLKYEENQTNSPILVYKSKNVSKSKLAANNLSLPVYKNNIASDIALSLNIGDEIKPLMFLPVAEIISKIFKNEKQDFNDFLDDAIFYSNFKSKLKIELGKNLEVMLKSSDLLKKIEEQRKSAFSKLGLILAPINVKINNELPLNQYVIKIGDNAIDNGEILPDKFLLINLNDKNPKNIKFDTKEPVFNLPAKWVDEDQDKDKNYNSIKATTVISVHLTEIIRKNAGELLTRQCIYQILEKLKSENSEKYVKDILDTVSIAKIQVVLTNLLNENIPIKEIEKILETMSIYNNNDTDLITEKIRQALSRTICEINKSNSGELLVLTLSSELEKKIAAGITKDGKSLSLEEPFVKKLLSNIDKNLKWVITEIKEQPTIICSSPIRPVFRKFIEKIYPQISIISYNEAYFGCKIKPVGTITA